MTAKTPINMVIAQIGGMLPVTTSTATNSTPSTAPVILGHERLTLVLTLLSVDKHFILLLSLTLFLLQF